MLATVSRKFELCTSRRLGASDWAPERRSRLYGPAGLAMHGTGFNPQVYVVLAGDVDPETGMMVDLGEVKERIREVLYPAFDHRHLNADTAPFNRVPPTGEMVGLEIMQLLTPLFVRDHVRIAAVHVREDEYSGVTVYESGKVDRHTTIVFCAARVTRSPHLSEEQNRELFGIAADPAGHGHTYHLHTVVSDPVDAATGVIIPYVDLCRALEDVRSELDHRHLNVQVDGLAEQPITTENLARYCLRRLAAHLPIDRVKLYEFPHFYAEHTLSNLTSLGVHASFDAMHRLHSPHLSDRKNKKTYGKCNNPNGHGHTYRTEFSVSAPFNEQTGTVAVLDELTESVESVVAGYHHKHLDRELDDFHDRPSTGENIIAALWQRAEPGLPGNLQRLRLWETPNNRFAIRR